MILVAAARLSFGLAGSLVTRAAPEQVLDLVARDRSLADAIDQELAGLMIATRRIVAENRAIIERVADALVGRFVLDGVALADLIALQPALSRRREPRLGRGQDRPRPGG